MACVMGNPMQGLIRRAQQVGLARAVCLVLLFALISLTTMSFTSS
jgi:hypothetical protein